MKKRPPCGLLTELESNISANGPGDVNFSLTRISFHAIFIPTLSAGEGRLLQLKKREVFLLSKYACLFAQTIMYTNWPNDWPCCKHHLVKGMIHENALLMFVIIVRQIANYKMLYSLFGIHGEEHSILLIIDFLCLSNFASFLPTSTTFIM